MNWPWLVAIFAPIVANLLQTWLQERIRRRQAPASHERIAERVVLRLKNGQGPSSDREG